MKEIVEFIWYMPASNFITFISLLYIGYVILWALRNRKYLRKR